MVVEVAEPLTDETLAQGSARFFQEFGVNPGVLEIGEQAAARHRGLFHEGTFGDRWQGSYAHYWREQRLVVDSGLDGTAVARFRMPA